MEEVRAVGECGKEWRSIVKSEISNYQTEREFFILIKARIMIPS